MTIRYVWYVKSFLPRVLTKLTKTADTAKIKMITTQWRLLRESLELAHSMHFVLFIIHLSTWRTRPKWPTRPFVSVDRRRVTVIQNRLISTRGIVAPDFGSQCPCKNFASTRPKNASYCILFAVGFFFSRPSARDEWTTREMWNPILRCLRRAYLYSAVK